MSQPSAQFCPTPRELDDLELLTSGALAPIARFDEPGSPITLALPDDLRDAAEIELVDPEGLPLARLTPSGAGGWAVEPLTHAQYGPFRRLRLTPVETRLQHAGRTVVPVTDAVTDAQLAQLRDLGPVLLLALVGTGTPELSPVALQRATLRVAELLDDAVVVAVPLASHGDAEVDHALGVQVAHTYAGDDAVVGLVDDPDGDPVEEVLEIALTDQPDGERRGLVLFFTGLSGSGKSTLAQALMDRLLEQGSRTLTSLDGDVVRRNLSAGLTFSKADRETNIRRIGWVAAEISRHGGVAVCSPIAPFDETRQQVRAMVDDAGGAFFLVHVATPLEECERRDRKGLYAKARRGEIPEFTGISSPYEEPADADVVVDTTGRTIDDALDDVIDALAATGYLDLRTQQPVEPGPAPHQLVEPGPAPHQLVEPGHEVAGVETPAPDETPLHVLFVCTANICRSPYMELAARRLAGDSTMVTFASAGTHGFDEHPMDVEMARALSEHGVEQPDLSAFLSRPLTRDLVAEADLVLTAEASHRQFILDDSPGAFRKVFTLGQAAEALTQVDETLAGADLLAALGANRGTADAALDVGDPYRRGPEAADQAAELIERRLQRIVGALIR